MVGEIGPGLVVLLGVGPDDTDAVADDLARKAAELRIFRDDGWPDEPVAARDRRGGARRLAVHAVSRTRVAAAARASPAPRRPSSPNGSTSGSRRRCASLGVEVATGLFGAEMAVELVNDGPFTIWLDTADASSPSGGYCAHGHS